MLNLYKALENQVTSADKNSIDIAKCAEVAANIAIDVLKIESEGIKAVKELEQKRVQGKNILDNFYHRNHQSTKENGYDNDRSNIKEYDDS